MMGNPKNRDSVNIMHLISFGSVGAEIGVWMGSSSEQFLRKGLKKFYMVDPWAVEPYKTREDDSTTNYENYLKKYSRLVGSSNPEDFQKYYDNIYNDIWNKYRSYPEAIICRQTSTEWFDSFEGEKLDWIYIDGDHSYSGVIADLNNSLKVLKHGALILGDDYKWGRPGDKGGVKKAVNEFVETHNFKINQHGNNQFSIQIP